LRFDNLIRIFIDVLVFSLIDWHVGGYLRRRLICNRMKSWSTDRILALYVRNHVARSTPPAVLILLLQLMTVLCLKVRAREAKMMERQCCNAMRQLKALIVSAAR
jgi:hypothetical protein